MKVIVAVAPLVAFKLGSLSVLPSTTVSISLMIFGIGINFYTFIPVHFDMNVKRTT